LEQMDILDAAAHKVCSLTFFFLLLPLKIIYRIMVQHLNAISWGGGGA
jgi:hypothetical protein